MKLRTIAALAVSLCAVPPALAQTPPVDNNNVKREPFRMIGNIYWVGHSQVGSFLVKTPAGLILIDSTSTKDWPWVRENIEKLGFIVKDVKILLNLHTHEEHMGGMARMKELTGAKLIVSEASAAEMAVGGRTDFREDGSQQYTPVKADQTVRDGERITLGGLTLTAHLTPGHSRGATTWTMDVEDGGKTYHTVFISGMSPAGIERATLLNNKKYPNIKEDFELAFTRLKSLPCDVWLYPRAPTIKLDEKQARLNKGEKPNPFVDPKGCQAYIAEYEKRFHDQLKQETGGR
ncbi:MAG: subclass B3 metallo-beta-lactamase [Vicinamibacterales bacterium]